ncbi:ExbD/TolR family protein [Mucilaginibacter lacusdianchii]|uniref:ExbD/TolR family protein n=1 Tax=Mucilaginibacter lacusdianchii TaxID=2684211 RepID=UPI00131D22A7|nr:biopolymer transporter ExbD [Mucilaginibacter sp. JXJ CY 39]
MPRVKVPRKSTAIDMTAMCDVAFLLLTFFIMTSKPRIEDPVPVDTPGAAEEQTLPEKDIAIITVGSGKAFFNMEGAEARKELLVQMGEKYKIGFTPTEAKAFTTVDNVTVPIAQLKQYLAASSEERKQMNPGIPTDSVSNELYNWIHEARVVTKNMYDKELRVSIKGDSKEEYPTMQRIIAILQKQKVNKFSLITTLRGK